MSEKRIPKVGEVWTDRFCSDNRVIEAVVDDRIYYTLGGVPYGQRLDRFLLSNNPPKPKPIDIWINHYPNGDYYLHPSEEGALEGKGGSNDTEYTNKIKTVHYREVLEE